MSEKSCRLCLKPSCDLCLDIFSGIGIEKKMVEILSEHFQCDVIEINNQMLKNCLHFFFTKLSFLYDIKIRLPKPIHYRMQCVKCVGQQRKHFMNCIKSPKKYRRNFSIHWWKPNVIQLIVYVQQPTLFRKKLLKSI